jgi:phosphoglycolate phosphatase
MLVCRTGRLGAQRHYPSMNDALRPAYDLLSFDLDGTLVDTASEIAEAANRALVDGGFAARSLQDVTVRVGHGTRNLMTRLLAEAREQPVEAQSRADVDRVLERFRIHYAEVAGSSARVYDGWPEALAAFQRAGIALACVTNKDAGFSATILEATGLAPFFGLLIGGDSLPRLKPDASVLRHALSHFGARAERTAHIGDSGTDVLAARNAGVAAWVVPWGYNGGEPIETTRPDLIFETTAQLMHHVLPAA